MHELTRAGMPRADLLALLGYGPGHPLSGSAKEPIPMLEPEDKARRSWLRFSILRRRRDSFSRTIEIVRG